MTLSAELYALAVMIAVGGVSGFLYDIYRALRSPFRLRGLPVVAGDILFWLVVAALIVLGILLAGPGELRGAYLLAAGGGAIIYFAGLSPFILPPMTAGMAFLCRTVSQIVHKCLYVLGLPVRGVKMIWKACEKWLGPHLTGGGRLSRPPFNWGDVQ